MPITELDTLKATLEAAGLRPNKALGQNFFIDGDRMQAIAEAACIAGMPVLEVGPGPGALTERLLPLAKSLIVVEKDAAMASLLASRLGDDEKLTIAVKDILHFDIPAAFQEMDFAAVGNLPYYITTPISERLLKCAPVSMTIMIQKEAADRFFAKPGDRVYGPLSIVSQVLYHASRVMDVPRSCYWPQPEVDSTVIRLVRSDGTTADDVKRFFSFLDRCFLMRRKTLYNGLGREQKAMDIITACGFDPAVRAEALTPSQLYSLYNAYCS